MDASNSDRRLSFEFFPTKTEQGFHKLRSAWEELSELNPEFFSVTYGAGGSTRDNTLKVVESFTDEDKCGVAPHLSFGGASEDEMLALLQQYQELGIDRIVALRGDAPPGLDDTTELSHATDLIEFIRQHFGEQFHLEVAAYPEIHPEAPSYDEDIEFLKMKFDAGANSAITQLFYSSDAYFYFLEQCRQQGIEEPVYPGIMPITDIDRLRGFSEKSGFDLPRWMQQKFESVKDDTEATVELGVEVVSNLCEQLLEGGAPGLHFYTMNSTEPTRRICNNLGWHASSA